MDPFDITFWASTRSMSSWTILKLSKTFKSDSLDFFVTQQLFFFSFFFHRLIVFSFLCSICWRLKFDFFEMDCSFSHLVDVTSRHFSNCLTVFLSFNVPIVFFWTKSPVSNKSLQHGVKMISTQMYKNTFHSICFLTWQFEASQSLIFVFVWMNWKGGIQPQCAQYWSSSTKSLWTWPFCFLWYQFLSIYSQLYPMKEWRNEEVNMNN